MPGTKGKGKPPGNSQKVTNKKPVKSGARPGQNSTKNREKVTKKRATEPGRDNSEDSYGGTSRTPPPKAGLPGPATPPERDKWAVAALTEDKALHDIPAWWKEGALHHQISKEKLSAIAEQLAKDCQGQADPVVRKPARQFWSLCRHLAGEEICDAVGGGNGTEVLNPIRLLWNMPIMVSLGPPNPATDPGQRLDPDTEPAPGGDGIRRLTEVSAKLAELERVWDTANAANDGAGNYTGDMWYRMFKCLSGAREAAKKRGGRGGCLLYPPLMEQWLCDTDGEIKVAIRKGLRRYVGVEQGKKDFRAACSDAQKIPDLSDATWVIENTCTVVFDGKKAKLIVSVSPQTVEHICLRHTMTFFSFAKKNARPINAFWQGSTTFAKMCLFVQHDLLPFVTEGCVQELGRYTGEVLEKGTDLRLYQVPNGPNSTIFVRANVLLEESNVIRVTVKTIAPDGPQAVGFLRSELLEIDEHLKALKEQK